MLFTDSDKKLQHFVTTETGASENNGLQMNTKEIEVHGSFEMLRGTCMLHLMHRREKNASQQLQLLSVTRRPDAKRDTKIEKKMTKSKETFPKMESMFIYRNLEVSTKLTALKMHL